MSDERLARLEGACDTERLARLEGAYYTLKVVRPMTLTVISIFLAALVFVLGLMATQQYELGKKIDAIPQRLSEEFRAMRAEMAAQTNAIANSITAARQVQPQIMLEQIPVILHRSHRGENSWRIPRG